MAVNTLPLLPARFVTVPSLADYIKQITISIKLNNIHSAQALMWHLFNTIDPTDMTTIYSNGIAIAHMNTHHWLVVQLHSRGIYDVIRHAQSGS